MARLILLSFAIIATLPCAVATAQDFGSSWLDRVTHELVEDEGVLSPLPLEFKATAGVLYTYDSNIFLTNTNRTGDSIITLFAGGALKYAQPNFDAEADLLVNYNMYLSEDNIDADEERFYGRLRYQGSKLTLQLAEVIRRESSPTDAVFTTRVSRFLSNTTPLIVYHFTEVFAAELQSDLQFVKFLRQSFAAADNFNTRTILTLAYTTDWNKMDLLLQGGYYTISYRDPASPPDASGLIARIGIRGEISTNLRAVALVGVTSANSDDFPGTTRDVSMTTGDVEIHLAFTPTEITTLYFDYTRRIGFSADGAPFQVVNSADIIAQIAIRDDLKLRGRIQYDRVSVPGGLRRAYYSIGAGAEFKVHPNVVLDGGLTYRWGVVPGTGGAGNFGDAIVTLGAAVLF